MDYVTAAPASTIAARKCLSLWSTLPEQASAAIAARPLNLEPRRLRFLLSQFLLFGFWFADPSRFVVIASACACRIDRQAWTKNSRREHDLTDV